MENKRGFTLIELLVVVLIIGILAAIALPQYKRVIVKTRYNSIKNTVESVLKSAIVYYNTRNEWPNNLLGLDVEIPNRGYVNDNTGFKMMNPSTSSDWCYMESTSLFNFFCFISPYKTRLQYGGHINSAGKITRECVAGGTTRSKIATDLCEEETKDTTPNCETDYCIYKYK